MTAPGRLLAVDIGGTFVDAIEFDLVSGEIRVQKTSTTPDAPARGVVAAVRALSGDLTDVVAFGHGTTLGLNAILQRRGADVGIIANEGFRDLWEIARAAIPPERMYNFSYAPPPLVPRRRRVGVRGRLDAAGREIVPLDEASVLEAGRILVETEGLTSLAVCFLHSYANPSHERRTAEILRAAYPHVSVCYGPPLHRESEAVVADVRNGYVSPAAAERVYGVVTHSDGGNPLPSVSPRRERATPIRNPLQAKRSPDEHPFHRAYDLEPAHDGVGQRKELRGVQHATSGRAPRRPSHVGRLRRRVHPDQHGEASAQVQEHAGRPAGNGDDLEVGRPVHVRRDPRHRARPHRGRPGTRTH
jgi:Hydantoinase/oxoprolinase N-terminal region